MPLLEVHLHLLLADQSWQLILRGNLHQGLRSRLQDQDKIESVFSQLNSSCVLCLRLY